MDEPNVLTLRGKDYTFGDLDAGIVEDEPGAVDAYLQLTKDMAAAQQPTPYVSGPGLAALLTLGAAAIRAGSDPSMTRERLRTLLRPMEGIKLYVPVGRALGFQTAAGDGAAGEAERPMAATSASQAPAPSSGA